MTKISAALQRKRQLYRGDYSSVRSITLHENKKPAENKKSASDSIHHFAALSFSR